MNINKVILVGRISNDIEQRQSQSGKLIAYFPIAVNRRFDKEATDFIDCVAFDKTAENIAKYFSKGSEIAIIGELHIDNYKAKDGTSRRSVKVYTDEWYFGNKKSDTKPTAPTTEQVKIDNDLPEGLVEDDELPF